MEFNEYNFGILSRAMKIEIRSANVNPVNFVNFLCIHRVFPFGSKIQIQQHEMLVSSVRMEANKKKLLWNVPKVMDPKRYASTWRMAHHKTIIVCGRKKRCLLLFFRIQHFNAADKRWTTFTNSLKFAITFSQFFCTRSHIVCLLV